MDLHSAMGAVFSHNFHPLSLLNFAWPVALVVSILLLFLSALSRAVELAMPGFRRRFVKEDEMQGLNPGKTLSAIFSDNDHFELYLRELRFLRLLLAFTYFVCTMAFFVPQFIVTDSGSVWLNILIYIGSSLLVIFLYSLLGEGLSSRIMRRKTGTLRSRLRFLNGSLLLFRPLLFVFRPLERLVNFLSESLAHLFTGKAEDEADWIPVEDYFMMLDSNEAEIEEEDEDHDLIRNIFRFDDTYVSDVMTHRTDIVALPLTASLEETLDLIKDEKYTRIPIYEETIDKVVGILHVKDMLPLMNDEKLKANFSLEAEMRQPIFTPETRVIRDLFFEMQRQHVQLAIVIDEYGGTAGIVTMEDLIEEILGDIEDEYDEDEDLLQRISANSWFVSGWCPIETLAEEIGQELPVDENDTVSGFVIDLLDRIPQENENVQVRYNNLKFEVLSVADNRIEKLRLTKDIDGEIDEREGESKEFRS